MGRNRGGLSTKIHARVDHQGRPIQFLIKPGQAHDLIGADPLLANLGQDTIIIADKAYDADRLRAHIKASAPSPNSQHDPAQKNASTGPKLSIASATTLNASQQAQAVPSHRYPLRQARSHLPGFHSARSRANLAPLN